MCERDLINAGMPWALVAIEPNETWQKIGPYSTALKTDIYVRLGSVSKLFVGAVAAYQFKKLPDLLSVRVAEVLGQTRIGNTLTVQDCLTHRTGLRDALENPKFRARVNADLTASHAIEEIIDAGLDLPSVEQRPRYANINAILVAETISKLSEKPFARLLSDAVGNGLHSDGILRKPHPEGWRYGRAPDQIEYGDQLYRATHFNSSWGGPAGALQARLKDIPSLLERAFGHLKSAPEIDGTYHWLAKRAGDMLWHDGDVPGFSSWAACQDDRIGFAVTGLSWVPDLGNPAAILGHSIWSAKADA